MADIGTLYTIAEKVYGLLQSPLVSQFTDYKSDLENLEKTVSSIKNMLLDADKKPELSNEERGWIDRLKDVLYDADDLFDEVITVAHQKLLRGDASFSKRVSKKVRAFLSSKNPVLVAYNTSQEVKSIRDKLAAIASDHERFGFKVDSEVTRKRREETCSFLHERDENIIGREDDVKAVVDMLLDPNVEEDVGFVAIVGVGGLGKTALARLVFNHNSVGSKFGSRLWSCVSDQDGKELDVQSILCKIIESATNKKPKDGSTMQAIKTIIQKELGNKEFLLVLDDVWTENPNEWRELRKYLMIGGKGSRVVVTTRSEKTAEMVLGKGTHSNKYMLKGLSNRDSWLLFESTAFGRGSELAHNLDLVNIGKKMVKRCYNVPLAIRVVGTLLYSVDTDRWRSFEECRLAEIVSNSNPILSILKLSYDNLEPSLKSCFVYCALFPKDFEMEKEMLISLWMAQGYIVPFNKRQSIEDAGEDHFSVLLKRCFFQDVKMDDCNEVISFKIHDLMHDLAQEVAGEEICVANCMTNSINGKKIRHLFLDGVKCTKKTFEKRKIRSCFMNESMDATLVKSVAANWTYLRTLRLYLPSYSESLPDSIGKLIHLRYFDLSGNVWLKALPNSITQLYNLQTLILRHCGGLRELPEDFSKLVNLRHLDLVGTMLICMPLGIEKLTGLRVLHYFPVGNTDPCVKEPVEQLKDLETLVNLRGRIHVKIHGDMLGFKATATCEEGWLEKAENLKAVHLSFPYKLLPYNVKTITDHEGVMAKLQPPRNIKHFYLFPYCGAEIPRWGRALDDWENLFPNLVKIHLRDCQMLHHLPLLSKLKHLKSLILFQVQSLEYMEDASTGSESKYGEITFFPSLELFQVKDAYRLKGWWRSGECNHGFARLSTLTLDGCPRLMSFPLCPTLETLTIYHSAKTLRIRTSEDPHLELRVLIHNVGYLESLSASRLTSICVNYDHKVESLKEFEDVFKGCSSSLKSLEFYSCDNLRSLSGVLQHLTVLESLILGTIPNLRFPDGDDASDMPWKCLHQNLRSLELKSLDNLKILPSGMKYLTSLRNLTLRWCNNLEAIPEWISCLSSLHSLEISCQAIKSLPGSFEGLTSLQKLKIVDSPDLIDMCREPDGKDWPKIRHIAHISIIDRR